MSNQVNEISIPSAPTSEAILQPETPPVSEVAAKAVAESEVNPDGQLKPSETTVAGPITDSVETAEPSLADLIDPAEPIISPAETTLFDKKNEVDQHDEIREAIKKGMLPNAEQIAIDERTKSTANSSLT